MRGSDILSIAEAHIGEKYILGAVVDYKNPNWKGPWDCAEFATWCTFQAYKVLYGCDADGTPGSANTGDWKTQSSSRGRLISLDEAKKTPGAFLLRYPASESKRIGHIVISAGDGSTIEAADTKHGVIRGVVDGGRRWDTGILIPGVEYAAGSVEAHSDGILRFQDMPQYSSAVAEVQAALKDKGFDPGPVDGLFGDTTESAIASFQAASGLIRDGEAGPTTLAALGLANKSPAAIGAPAVTNAPSIPIKSIKFNDLKTEYETLYKTLQYRNEKLDQIKHSAARVLAGKAQYAAVAKTLGAIPWYVIGVIHEMEASCNFTSHLHNGDPLTAKTKHVPAGRPKTGTPPFNWVDSAIDALSMKAFDKETDWTLPRSLHRLESYNGFGSRKKGVFTPYLWSGSRHYASGKYTFDNVWDPNAVSQQIGAAVILHMFEDASEIQIARA